MKTKTKANTHDSKIEKDGELARVACSCGFTSSWVDPERIIFDEHLQAYIVV